MRKLHLIPKVLTLILVLCVLTGCADASEGIGTLTSVAGYDLMTVYKELVEQPNGGIVASAVTEDQIGSNSAAGWQYLCEETANVRVELRIYQNGDLTDTPTVLPGGADVNGTILFGASSSEAGYVFATDLDCGGQMQSHRYTYEAGSRSEPQWLTAETTALEPDQEIWLAALLFDSRDGYEPADIAALQEDGLGQVPLAAVLTATFAPAAA